MANSSIIRKRMTAERPQRNLNNSSYNSAQAYPPMIDASDYEVQVHVNFQTREMRLLKVIGVNAEADVFLFTREKCRQDCSDSDCLSCKTRKLYQDKAGDPQGTVPYSPYQEYLYCLRFDRQPITALLALTPREQDVEVKEKGLLAYWFMKWLERAKILSPEGAVADIQRMLMAPVSSQQQKPEPQQPTSTTTEVKSSAPPPAPSPPPPPPPQQQQEEEEEERQPMVQDDTQTTPPEEVGSQSQRGGTTSEDCLHKQTSAYLPNLQVIYQVKKDQMSIVLPKPEQLTRPIDVLLVASEDSSIKPQSITLVPGAAHSNHQLVAMRNYAYTLKVQLHEKGKPVDLLDFITEHKILRVQESKDAPKQLNFLMERLIEQRGTFVLHITFDEKIVEVGTRPIGEFYLDVDVDSHKMMIGTIQSHSSKFYRVEKINRESNTNILLADKQLIFEGGVDPNSLTIKETIPIERMSDYLITVVDPVTKQALPTSILAFQKSALFVKEIKNSDVRLHVTVQRQPTMMSQSSNANNRRMSVNSPVLPIRRTESTGQFHCPFRNGWSGFRIHHSTSGEWLETPMGSSSSLDATSMASSTFDTVCKQSEACFSLDVDLPSLKARLISAGSTQPPEGALFIIYEENFDGKIRSTPCQMGQSFKVKHWCKYTVKCIEGSCLSPLLTFCVTDKEVTDIRPCSSSVRLAKRSVQGAI